MKWLVCLDETCDGGTPADEYARGVVIEDRRESAHDLIAAANAEWGTKVVPGEVYSITELDRPRYVKIENGARGAGSFRAVAAA